MRWPWQKEVKPVLCYTCQHYFSSRVAKTVLDGGLTKIYCPEHYVKYDGARYEPQFDARTGYIGQAKIYFRNNVECDESGNLIKRKI